MFHLILLYAMAAFRRNARAFSLPAIRQAGGLSPGPPTGWRPRVGLNEIPAEGLGSDIDEDGPEIGGGKYEFEMGFEEACLMS